MFKIKAKIKDNVVVKEGMYFMYGLNIFKVSKIVDGKLKLAHYDESSGKIYELDSGYTTDFIQSAIISGNYKVIEPENGEVMIPGKLKEYVIQY